jgi:hypothetical protein
MYLDGGFECVKRFFLPIVKEQVGQILASHKLNDPKSLLQEIIQQNGETLQYEKVGESGPDHDKRFTCVVKLNSTVIGKGEGYTNAGYDQKPDWEANLQVAQSITDALNEQADGLCKEVRLKSGRFNQHISTGCILVEAGNNRNTLAQVLAAMPYLADAIVSVLKQP